jgi:uncharacterized membrane protein
MCAIVIDVGNLFVEKRSIQQAADAAALAAAQRLPGVACDSACRSGVAETVSGLACTQLARSCGGAG